MFVLMQFLIFVFFILVGCGKTNPFVEQHGGMRDALRMGNTQSRVTFEEISSKPHAFAVGALTNLEGEITIVDGQILVATTLDGVTAFSTTGLADQSATLLTVAYVENWAKDTIPENMDFESAVETVAKRNGVDVDKPFPFYMHAIKSSFDMHVINGFCPIASLDLPKEDQPWRLHGKETDILVVGFFAKNQEGVMTHHGSNIHMHGIVTSGKEVVSGHLDTIEVLPGSTIFVPSM
jgi:acetolactate decarboxylase